MPRTAREKSKTGIYHIVLRGINKQRIFEENEDCQKFLSTLKKYKFTSEYEIYGYCLMSNHIHLLMKEGKEDLGIVFRRIGASFVYWYNWKYNRFGHLFQDRFKSEAVETTQYFLTALRYIHQNPVKAGIAKVDSYHWSSYCEYVKGSVLCNTAFALSFFSEDTGKAIEQFKKFNLEENKDRCLEYEDGARLNDEEATEIIKAIGKVKSPVEILSITKEMKLYKN